MHIRTFLVERDFSGGKGCIFASFLDSDFPRTKQPCFLICWQAVKVASLEAIQISAKN
ncbi:hypothetical protein J2736_006785 [Paenibacillus qinlingensis]|uniref:Uncharacterized protein n=1 Tax=Paenibacillus qinlingensis TaxID=1837343 RepID=A0ABU1P6Y0_9BACL|nr:hypothetical protein [Paenibacillus qinlingensis]